MPRVKVPTPSSTFQEQSNEGSRARLENVLVRAQPEGSKNEIALINTPGLAGVRNWDVATSYTLTTGNQTAGTYAYTASQDSDPHTHTDDAGTMELYYEFSLQPGTLPTTVEIVSYVTGTGDTIEVYGYDWVTTTWELVWQLSGSGSTSYDTQTASLDSDMVGTTGVDDGKVRIRFYSTGLTTCTLAIDFIRVYSSLAIEFTHLARFSAGYVGLMLDAANSSIRMLTNEPTVTAGGSTAGWVSKSNRAGSALYTGITAVGDELVMFQTGDEVYYTSFLSGSFNGLISQFESGTDWSDITHLDGYFLIVKKDTNQFYIATSNGSGGTTYDSTEFGVASGIQGYITAIRAAGRYVWVFKENGAEVFFNSGDADFPFERVNNAVYPVPGPSSPGMVVTVDDRCYWTNGEKGLWRTSGASYEPVDTSGLPVTSHIESYINSFRTRDGNVIILNATDTETGLTIPYYYAEYNGTWTCAVHYSSGTATQLVPTVSAQSLTYGGVIAFDGVDELYEFSDTTYKMESYSETDYDHLRKVIFGPLTAGGEWFFINEFYIDLSVNAVTLDTLSIRYSDDGGATWSSSISDWVGSQSPPQRAKWTRLGRARHRIFELTVDFDSPFEIFGAWADITVGMR